MLILTVLTCGCRTDVPEQAIADSTMVDLLVELHLANGRIEVSDRPLEITRDSIIRAYGVDSMAYASMIEYYTRHPDEYSQIYGQVLDELSAERVPTQLTDTTRTPSGDATRGG